MAWSSVCLFMSPQGQNQGKSWGPPSGFPHASLSALCQAHGLIILPSGKDLLAKLQGETARATIGSPWTCAYGVSKLCVLSNETVGFQKKKKKYGVDFNKKST